MVHSSVSSDHNLVRAGIRCRISSTKKPNNSHRHWTEKSQKTNRWGDQEYNEAVYEKYKLYPRRTYPKRGTMTREGKDDEVGKETHRKQQFGELDFMRNRNQAVSKRQQTKKAFNLYFYHMYTPFSILIYSVFACKIYERSTFHSWTKT
uniref:Uncharacterized protein n=1 Tax=Megaselia scalaris TaxID=36166 RepID=T1GB43_MEGSC